MTIVGTNDLAYTPVEHWMQLPDDVHMIEAVGIAVDSRDQVFVFNRGDHPILRFDVDGQVVDGWGGNDFIRPHGIWIGADDTLYLVDDQGHSIRQFSQQGKLLRALGPAQQPSDTGMEGSDYRTIRRSGDPFNCPTNLVVSSNGDIFVTDGYGNARVHHFTAAGEMVKSWGQPGDGPGQFQIPHGIGIDENDRLYVADRENNRIQIFSPAGEYIGEWTDVVRPCEVFVASDNLVYVAELGGQVGLFPWMERDETSSGGRISIFNRQGERLARWGGGDNPRLATEFYALHDIQVDSNGNIYTAEVVATASKRAIQGSAGCPTIRKFVRCRQ